MAQVPWALQHYATSNHKEFIVNALVKDVPSTSSKSGVKKTKTQTGKKNQPSKFSKSSSRPLKWHGGKEYLAGWIISLMPERAKNTNKPASDDEGWLHYVEPFFGGGAVLFAQDPDGISEVINDANGELTNFWTVLQSEELYGKLCRRLSCTPFSETEFQRVLQIKEQLDPVERAVRFFVRYRQSRQGLGRDFATMIRNRTRSRMNEHVSAWLSAIEGLEEVHSRFQRVVVMNKDACKLIQQQDGPRTLFYCDPPYVLSTRSTGGEYGPFEMTDEDHVRLLETLAGIKGRFLLSGYPSDLYAEFAAKHEWRRVELLIDNKASSSKKKEKKTECIWMNY